MTYLIIAAVIAAFILLVARMRSRKASGGRLPSGPDSPSRPRNLDKH